jgi:hypothetical protein
MKLIDSAWAGTGIRAAVVALVLAAGAGVARADTLWFEAEDNDELSPSFVTRTITSPMRIVDRTDASGGSSIEVQNGLDSKTSVPTLGRSCYSFEVTGAGSYKVWGRVIARTDEDDSFWVRMDSGSWIKWNEVALGENWHWDFVHDDVNNTQPITFSLSAGAHTLCVAYREDDTRLDVLVVTDDTAFDPRTGITGAPQPAQVVTMAEGGLAWRVEWMTVLGATSYAVERQQDGGGWIQQTTGLTGHTFTQSGLTDSSTYCYRVIATGPTGSSAPSEGPCRFTSTGASAFTFASNVSLTSPLQFVTTPAGHTGFAVAPGNNSLSAAPSTGWARFDFKLGGTVTMKAHAQVSAPNPDSDSFWVRMDGGTWIKWNNLIEHDPCDYDNVHNSDAGGASVNFNLGPGSHFIEFAYREEGTAISKIYLTTSTETEGVGLCFD